MRVEKKMPFAAYIESPGISATRLKQLAKSPLHYQIPTRIDPASAVKGRAAHTAVLEPMQFLREYALYEGKVRRGKDYEAFAEQHQNKTILNQSEYELALRMQDAVHSHSGARDLLRGGDAELSVFWTDPNTRRDCKSRLDYVSGKAIVDLKTCADIGPYKFGAAAARYGYDLQAAFYADAWFSQTLSSLPFFFVCVEKKPPFDVAVYEVPEDVLIRGRYKYQSAIQRLVECEKANLWPGAYPETMTLHVPDWDEGPKPVRELIFGEEDAA